MFIDILVYNQTQTKYKWYNIQEMFQFWVSMQMNMVIFFSLSEKKS